MELKNVEYNIEGINDDIGRIKYEFEFNRDLTHSGRVLRNSFISGLESIAESQYEDEFVREEFPYVTDSTAKKVISYKNKTGSAIDNFFKMSISLELDEKLDINKSNILCMTNTGDSKKIIEVYKEVMSMPLEVSKNAEDKLRNMDHFVSQYANK